MRLLYSFSVKLYTLLIRLASVRNQKAKAWVEGRKDVFEKIAAVKDDSAEWIWFHAASLGEFEQGRPLIEAIKSRYPHFKILLTFFSPSGYALQKDYSLADLVTYLPVDSRRNAAKICTMLRLKAVFFIKYEFWYNYLTAIHQAGIPLYFISVRFRKSQHFFKWYGGWFRRQLQTIDHFFVQDTASAGLLRTIGISRISVSGDTRFDRVATIAHKARPFNDIESFINGRKCIIAGSTWPTDEKLLMKAYDLIPNDYCLIIAPHDVSENHVQQLVAQLPAPYQRYSRFEPKQPCNILVIDSIGILSQLYQYASFAYIGGGFGHAIHNIQEAITFGCPVIFGPRHKNFNEANDLVALGGAFSIQDANSLITIMNKMISQEGFRDSASKICLDYIHRQLGATGRIMKVIGSQLESNQS